MNRMAVPFVNAHGIAGETNSNGPHESRSGECVMIDMGWYKISFSQTYRCHFDPDNQEAFARGPLPALTTAYNISVNDENEAVEKLKQDIGVGVLVRPFRP